MGAGGPGGNAPTSPCLVSASIELKSVTVGTVFCVGVPCLLGVTLVVVTAESRLGAGCGLWARISELAVALAVSVPGVGSL